MNIASQQTYTSLAQRLAKVRNCMLVELSTGVSPTDKDLFASLCQTYEQNSVMPSRTTSTLPQNTLDRAFSFLHLIPENILPHELAAMLGRNAPSKQHRVGFSIIRWPNLDGEGGGFDDWDKARG